MNSEHTIKQSLDKVKELLKDQSENSAMGAFLLANQIIKCDPQNEEANELAGICSYLVSKITNGTIDEAISYFEKSTPRPFALNGLGLCYRKNKEYDKAICFFKQAIEVKDEPGFRNNLALCYFESEKQTDRPKLLEIEPSQCFDNEGFFTFLT